MSMSAHAPVPRVLNNSLMCASKPMCSCQLGHFHGVDVSCHVWTLCKVFRKWNCFGDDVIAEQPSHPCLVVCDAMGHVTPSVFLSSFFYSQSNLWASASEPAGSVPATQSQEREVGTIALWPHARACIFLSSESWLKQCSFKECLLCLWNE